MKINQITIISITAVLLFTLVGCEEPKGYLERKEPKPEVKSATINLNVRDAWEETENESDNLVDLEH